MMRTKTDKKDALEAMRTQERNRLHVARAEILEGIEEHIEYLGKAVEAIDAEIKQKIDDDPTLEK